MSVVRLLLLLVVVVAVVVVEGFFQPEAECGAARRRRGAPSVVVVRSSSSSSSSADEVASASWSSSRSSKSERPCCESIPTEAAGELTSALGDIVEKVRSQWINGGWQVRKRAGRWLPEIVQQPSEAMAAAEREVEWLSTGVATKALASASMPETERELAVASEFGTFLRRADVTGTFERGVDGSVVFPSEAALSASVAMFTVEVSKELGAAARALARYVDDLETELAAADATAVRLRTEVTEAAREAREKSEAAREALDEADRLMRTRAELEETLGVAQEAARRFEDQAETASLRVVELETTAKASNSDLATALEKAARAEARLEKAEASVTRHSEEATLATQRAEAAESLARAATRDRDAVEDVAAALRRRAYAAEQTANETAARLQAALLDTIDSEAKLSGALDEIPDDGDVRHSLEDARDAVRQQLDRGGGGVLPSIWKLKKADLKAELESYGRDPTGFKVPELRAAVRVERLKRESAAAPALSSTTTPPEKVEVETTDQGLVTTHPPTSDDD